MAELPTGTVTFLFTDVEGSTRLLQELGDGYVAVLEEHRRLLRDAFARHGGVEVDTQGDAFFVAFATASDALAAAAEGRDALAGGPVRVRIGLHTGEPTLAKEGYVGIDVHRAARIAAAGHGGQILVSQATRDLAGANGLRDLGEHRLKDLAAPERIYQFGGGDFPPLKSLNNSNLPLPAEPLIGRKKELADVLRLFREGARLVTVTGPGGIGKTRFALDVAAELIDEFNDGVWWVGLAPLRDPSLVSPTIAAAVGAQHLQELHNKHLLLLLDNFEQVVEAARGVAELQQASAHVSVLVTSREPLHVAGEREYALPPLPEAPAVELLRQRAEAIRPGFDADYRQLVELCDRIDRLPLAIELVAARTKFLSPDDLLDRLDERLPLLTSRRRDVDERQRTLAATISWSHDLLDDEERQLFVGLSVFAGSFDAAAASAVCGADLETLESLVDKSLLRTVPDSRFFMFETIREFATSQRDADDVAARHAEYFLHLAEEAAPHLTGSPEQPAWFGRLERELDNLRAALSFFRDHDEHELEFRLAVALWEFWWTHGYVGEGRGYLLHALQSAGVPETSVGINALEGACYLSYLDDDERDALAWSDRLLQLAERLGDDLSLAHAWQMRALLTRDEGERVRLHTRVIELAADDPFARHAVEALGLVALQRGELDEARRHFERAMEIGEGVRDRNMVFGELILLAAVSADLGHHDEAIRYLRAAAEEGRQIGDKTPFMWERVWTVTSIVLTARGAPADACRVLGAAERLREVQGTRLGGFTEEFHRRAVAKIEAVASIEDVERAWEEGRQLGSREYLDEMLRSLD